MSLLDDMTACARSSENDKADAALVVARCLPMATYRRNLDHAPCHGCRHLDVSAVRVVVHSYRAADIEHAGRTALKGAQQPEQDWVVAGNSFRARTSMYSVASGAWSNHCFEEARPWPLRRSQMHRSRSLTLGATRNARPSTAAALAKPRARRKSADHASSVEQWHLDTFSS